MSHLMILGGSSPIGIECIKIALKKNFRVTVIGRKKPNIKDKNFFFKKIDFLATNNWKKIFIEINKKNLVTNLIFLQRSREKNNIFLNELKISILPVFEIIKEFYTFNLKTKNKKNKSILIFTSPIVDKAALVQSLSYHISKAILNQIIKYFSVYLGKIFCNINGLAPDIVYKERAKNYFKKNIKLKKLFTKIIPLKKMATTKEIAKITISLIDPKFYYLNGQIITLDGGLNSHTNSSIARLSSNFIKDEIDLKNFKI